jgi:hypothetical protein
VAGALRRKQTVKLGFHSATEAKLVKITLERRQTREDSGHISIHQGVRQIEGYAQNGPRCVIPNSGQRTKLPVFPGEHPIKAANQLPGGLMEVTGAAIIAES